MQIQYLRCCFLICSLYLTGSACATVSQPQKNAKALSLPVQSLESPVDLISGERSIWQGEVKSESSRAYPDGVKGTIALAISEAVFAKDDVKNTPEWEDVSLVNVMFSLFMDIPDRPADCPFPRIHVDQLTGFRRGKTIRVKSHGSYLPFPGSPPFEGSQRYLTLEFKDDGTLFATSSTFHLTDSDRPLDATKTSAILKKVLKK
jgi:hypothetical protein